jgi:hypothetical protein
MHPTRAKANLLIAKAGTKSTQKMNPIGKMGADRFFAERFSSHADATALFYSGQRQKKIKIKGIKSRHLRLLRI